MKALFINNWKTDFLNEYFSYFLEQKNLISVTQKSLFFF